MERLLHRARRGPVTWRIASTSEADAWWVNGAHARLRPDGMVRVPPAIPQERALRLRPGEADRPIAFCEPVPATFAAHHVWRFDPTHVESVSATFDHFAGALRARATELALAADVLAHEGALHAGFCHLVSEGRLLAVLDPRGHVGIAPGTSAQDIARASWTRSPPDARHVPDGFDRVSLTLLMWRYTARSRRDLLPVRYRNRLIYFRRPPRVANDLVKDTHVTIMRELLQAPASFAQLRHQTGLSDSQLARGLSELYFAGSITTDPRRAAAAAEARSAEFFETGAASVYSGLQSRADMDWPRSTVGPELRAALAT